MRRICVISMFVFLIFAVCGSASAASFQGTWSSNQGTMLIYQNGDQVLGTYSGASGTIEGTVSGNVLTGRYKWKDKAGVFELTMSADGKSFSGKWSRESAQGAWSGKKTGELESDDRSAPPESPPQGDPPDGSTYEVDCTECGKKQISLGNHRFCALTGVASGGFNSGCYVRRSGTQWVLIATDPEDSFGGESQRCEATCFD